MVKSLKVRIALLKIGRYVIMSCIQPVHQEPHRIAVPRRDIEICPDIEMVKLGDPSHVVMDQRRRAMGAQNVRLGPVEQDDLIGREAAERHDMGRIGFCHREVRQFNLREIRIFHRPEHVAPCPVQCIGRLVPLGTPILKARFGGLRKADRCVVAPVFVVCLPGRDAFVGSITLREFQNDLAALSQIALMRKTVMTT